MKAFETHMTRPCHCLLLVYVTDVFYGRSRWSVQDGCTLARHSGNPTRVLFLKFEAGTGVFWEGASDAGAMVQGRPSCQAVMEDSWTPADAIGPGMGTIASVGARKAGTGHTFGSSVGSSASTGKCPPTRETSTQAPGLESP